MTLDGKYDPINEIFHMDLIHEKFHLIGNYTTQLHFFQNDSYFVGEGSLHFASTGYEVRNIQFPVQYDPNLRKFQMLYPKSFEPRNVDLSGEMTGLKNAKTGEPVSMMEMFSLCTGLDKPRIVEIWQTVGNYTPTLI